MIGNDTLAERTFDIIPAAFSQPADGPSVFPFRPYFDGHKEKYNEKINDVIDCFSGFGCGFRCLHTRYAAEQARGDSRTGGIAKPGSVACCIPNRFANRVTGKTGSFA